MSDDPERDYYAEALAILDRKTLLLPQVAHLEALQEHHECDRVKLANSLNVLRNWVLEEMR